MKGVSSGDSEGTLAARVAGEVDAGSSNMVAVTALARVTGKVVASTFASMVANVRIVAIGELSSVGGVSAVGPNAWSLFR